VGTGGIKRHHWHEKAGRDSQIVDAGDGVLSLTKLVLVDMRGGRDRMCLMQSCCM
jgi:hypothetical protein